ncbi:2-oxo-4-hydroxy-4-carboxy-5-ureidoimidazoline decarboxylase [Mycobacterium sp. E740]|nr:2-oxo-4-hydroxy-4-carboxy-5-ureidoimidazoline decarboxylase [Mycobacterium sp. E740]
MHQGIGLAAFNTMPMRRAVHALYECCYSVPLAADLASGRPYTDYDALYRTADAVLFGLPDDMVDSILHAHPDIGRRPGSTKSAAEQCAIWCDEPDVMERLRQASKRYTETFGSGFVMLINGYSAHDVLATMADRMHNDTETERKVMRNELARVNRSRFERMLGPESGYDNW